ncbi:Rieske 2Fe-2S domain-containing protein [Actinoplanes sp. NPDC051633]|uniref:Rieske 2Fe-2S domain-containing protein n=1 Tax=Actinoplanes sp. NPDC051633 TaxID=3155670 RepID=UPI00344093AE
MVARLEKARSLDTISDRLQKIITGASPQVVKNFLHGTWLGHPLHPVLIHAPIGAFLSAAVLDAIPGQDKAAGTLITVGAAASPVTIAAGWTDWSQLSAAERRVGLVHAATNAVAVGLFVASLSARASGRTARGKALSYAGMSLMGAGAYLGGHLTYSQAAGVNQAAPDLQRLPSEWTAVGELASLPDGKPLVKTVDDVPILLFRSGDKVTAMLERCSHETGPLGDGDVVGVGAEACVVCPWHGSTFRLRDGVAVRGPAANDQPVLRSRVTAGVVEIAQP